jgi:CRP-like cAMP-binding protein
MAGDLFGELCLSGQAVRIETAVVMQDSTLRLIPHRGFIGRLQMESLLEDLVQYLAVRISEQHEIISTMATANSEQRLAKTILSIGRRMGSSGSGRIVIDYRISHEELSEMVGTTRPRVGVFLKKFRTLGLIQIGTGHRIIIDEEKLQDYIRVCALGEKVTATLSQVACPDKAIPKEFDSDIHEISL